MPEQHAIPKAFAKIDDLLTRWRKEITSPTSDKPELAEEGIKLFYKTAGKKPPLMLWCDSPIQIILIPVLVGNVLRSDAWKTLVANMGSAENADSAQYLSKWKSQWIKVEKNTVLPLLERIWNFQFKNRRPSIQQNVLDRLSEHLFAILKDGRLNAETVHQKNCKKPKSEIFPGPTQIDMWRRFIGLSAEIERKTTADFSFSMTTAQGLFAGVVDHRVITNHIPVVKDLLSPSEEQKEFLKRVQHIRTKCAELERISTTRAALLTEAMTGFTRPAFVPDVDPTNFDPETEWKDLVWNTFNGVRKDIELRQLDPRAVGMVTWGANASWLPLALSCRMLDSGFLAELEEKIDSWAYMFHGAAGYYLGDQVCFVCRQPKTLVTNDSGQPHSAFGAAVTWSDEFDIHCWRGIIVDPDLLKRAHEINIKQILAEENVETRRIMLDMFGEERFIRESCAEVVHRDQYGVLYRHMFKLDEPLLMVRVRNATRELDGSHKDYYLRVPPTMTTAKEAVAWTFGLTADEYAPEHES